MTNNGIQIENSPNILIITDSDQNQITVTQPVVSLVEVSAVGPQGQKGDQGDSIFQLVSGSVYSTTSSLEVSGSFTVSGSSTFKNIGPAIFSGSVTSTQGFTGSLFGSSSYALTASYAMNGGSGGGGFYIATGSVSASVGLGTGSFTITSGSSTLFTVDNVGAISASSALITGNVVVQGTASINTLIVNQTQLSTGSNQLGDAADDTQTLYGTVTIPTGSLTVTGSIVSTGGFTGSLFGTASYTPTLAQVTTTGNTTTNAISVGGLTIPNIYSGINNVGLNFNYTNTSGYNSGNITFSQYYNSTKITLGNGTSNSSISQTNSVLLLETQNVGSINYNARNHIFDTSLASGSVEWKFQTVSAMKLFSTGNLTINTTTDSGFKLDVNGTGRFSGNLTIAGSATNSLLVKGSGATSATNALLVQNSNATPSLTVLDNGFVGIGTGSAAYNLDVSGSIRSTSDLFINGSARLRYDSNNNISLFGGINFTTGQQNLVIGTTTGFNINSGFYNTLLGHNAGQGLYQGTGNTFVGWRTGGSINPQNSYNSFLGYEAGRTADTSYSVFLGYQAGYSEVTSNKLYIANSSGSAPLIGGDFTRGRVGINVPPTGISASLHISGAASTSSAALLVYKSGSTVVDVQGSSGQLFSITDSLTGSLFSVNTVAGLPVMEAFSDNTVNIGKFGVYPIKVAATGTLAVITGSLFGSATTASYVNPLTQSVFITGSLITTGSVDATDTIKTYVGFEAYRTGARRVFLGGSSSNGQLLLDSGGTWDVNLLGGSDKYFRFGNFGIGTISPTAKLQVVGSGTTSATTALLVQNANASSSLVVLDNGYVGINTGSAAYNLDVSGTARISGNLTVSRLVSYYGVSTAQPINIYPLNYLYFEAAGPENNNINKIDIRHNFVGSLFNGVAIQPTINQTSYSGITRGLYVNPTLTSATDFRAIETTAGSVLFNGGRVNISGSASTSSAALTVYKSGSTVMSIQGSQGELFSITDSLSGSLFSVSNISGLPIVEVFSDDSIVMGNYATPAMVITGSSVSVATASAAPTGTAAEGTFRFAVVGGAYYIYAYLGGAWRSGSLA